jgi:YegS/Rv2252/BmrU family lipid kinase
MKRSLLRVDRRLVRSAERHRSPLLDELFTGASQIANRSLLWFALAGLFAAFGDRRGKQAAADGLVAIALASAIANGPVKLVVRRARPSGPVPLVRPPRTTSFPSGHAASAFAFAVAASREMPPTALLVIPLAAVVSSSRVYVGVHYPSDVLLGAALGAGAGMLADTLLRAAAGAGKPKVHGVPSAGIPQELVLVFSPYAGRSSELATARRVIDQLGLLVVAELKIDELARLPDLTHRPDGEPRMVVAAGGDGTVGAVADAIANRDSVLGVLPLGTSNDFARSLGIPVNPARAAEVLAKGKISTIDLGRLVTPGEPPRHFVHAATMGLNVNFAKLATRASIRARLGRLTYVAAAVAALRERPTFECDLRYSGRSEHLALAQLSVINAPIFGGALGMRVGGANLDDRLLDVLAFEALPLHRIAIAALYLLLHIKREVRGVHAVHLASLKVQTNRRLEVALDGEVSGTVPGDFEVVGEALHAITPLDFQDTHDGGPRTARQADRRS